MKTCSKTLAFICFLLPAFLQAQSITKMDFRNQAISDVLMALADMGRQSIILDDTVTGNATFYFSDSDFEDALFQFTGACNLFVEKRNNAYYVSKIRISLQNGLVSVETEDVNIESLIKNLSRAAGKTILYDPLPRASITLHSLNVPLKDMLETIIKKYPDFSLVEENNAFYLRQTAQNNPASPSRLSNSSITRSGDLFSMNIQRGNLSAILALLFRTAEKEYSPLQRVDAALENLYYRDKSFEDILRIVLEQGNCDYTENNGIYYIFEVQRRDILKNFKDIIVIQLLHIPVEDAIALLPSDYSGSSFIKTNKNTNSLYLSGSTEEIQPISNFLSLIDVPVEDKKFYRFELHYLKVRDFISLLPRELSVANPLVIPGSNAFVVQTTTDIQTRFNDFIALTDRLSTGLPIRLKYIKSEDLIQNLPPSVIREEVAVSSDPTLIFYTGTEEKRKLFIEHLALIDQPKPQIRYQLLVMQYQRSDNVNWNKSFSGSAGYSGEEGPPPAQIISGAFSNLVDISFDIVSEFGFQLAAQLNLQLGEDRAKVLADTTLNGLSGQDIKFENTATFRYRDTTIDPETGKPFYTGVTREITSGLILGINGWLSGDGMITMKVNATVSKQDDSGANTSATTNPPPTSTRIVNTQVRTKSGTPIVIGGLLQIEKNSSVKKIPFLGSIPLLGKLFQDIITSDITSEMVIYIVPFVHQDENTTANFAKKNEEYFNRFIRGEGLIPRGSAPGLLIQSQPVE
jgi:type II secretory pathway component GspD/PulD (secretin)